MNRSKRGLAWLLAMLLLVSSLPTAVFAAEGTEKPPAGEMISPSPSEPLEEVAYYLGDAIDSVVVTKDIFKADTLNEDGYPYVAFAEDGSYTIPLPSQTEFPTVVHFLANGQEFPIVFGSVSAAAEVGGHSFYVCLEKSEPEPEEPLDLYIDIDGQRVDLALNEAAPLSMLPLEEKYYTLDLRDYFPEELKSVDVSDMLGMLRSRYSSSSPTQDPSKVAAWIKYSYYDEDGDYIGGNDDYAVVGEDMTLDLSDYYRYGTDTYYIELIIGTADPLNTSNQRYVVEVSARGTADSDLLDAAAYRTGSPRSEIRIYSANLTRTSYTQNGTYYSTHTLDMSVDPKTWQSGQEAYVSLRLKNLQGFTAKVYEGRYETADALSGAKDITDQIWNQNSLSVSGGYRVDFSGELPVVTLALTRTSTGKTALVLPFSLDMYEGEISLSYGGIYADAGGGRTYIVSSSRSEGRGVRVYTLDPGYAANGQYYYYMRLNNPADRNTSDFGRKYVKKAVVGHYETEAEIPSGAEDIKSQLFSGGYSNGGYKADYSGGVSFTVVDVEGGIHWSTVKTVASSTEVDDSLPPAPTPLSEDTYFRMRGATGLNAYVMPYNADSYYFNGFQTVLLLNGSGPVANSSEITPDFYSGNKVDVRLGHNEDGNLSGGEKQISGESKVKFQNGEALLYSAAAENGTALKNYWVTFLTQQQGAKLFVNGINDETRDKDEETGDPIREVFLTGDYNYHHDIFFANIGNQALTGLKVELLDAQNVRLDDYWTIHQNGTTTLAPFTGTSSGDELANVGKIRLMPIMVDGVVQSGAVSGTLKISSANGGSVSIKLKGTAGAPQIVTDILPDGVRYVPYSSEPLLEVPEGSKGHIELTEGVLPSGLYLDTENYVITGTPMAAGTWTFHILAQTASGGEDPSYGGGEGHYSITVLNNTDAAVKEPNDYPIIEPVGRPSGSDPNHFYKTEYSEERLVIDGPYSDFFRLRIDGTELHEPEDYTSEEGSTVITIRSQTFQRFGEGTHTISAEYREGGKSDGALKRVAQNYTLTISRPSGGGSSGGSSSGSSRPSSTSTKKPEQKPQQPAPKPTLPFTDVSPSDWFYEDLMWAYENEIMLGVSDTEFAPQRKVSQATIVTVLARLAKIDLTRFEGEEEPGIPAGQSYTAAAVWAKRAGLLPEEGAFTGDETTTRNQMAVMLVKYLRSMGKDTTPPAQPAVFADAEDMTQEGNDAFQVLYQQSIFKGVGGLNMNAAGSTTRAHFVALIHRIYEAAVNQE